MHGDPPYCIAVGYRLTELRPEVAQMRRRKRWLVPTMLVGAAFAWMRYRRGDLGRLAENLHRYSAPNPSLYDAVTAPLLGGFFTRVAHDLAELGPRARVLEVGSGPGRLAVKLAEVAPGAEITGVDIAPEMIQRASSLAASSRVTDRLVFRVGDVAALPFPDASFDVVVSTFSAHHWPDRPAVWQRSTECCAQAARLWSTTSPTGSRGPSGKEQAWRSLPTTAPLGAMAPTRAASRPNLVRSQWSTGRSSGVNSQAHLARAPGDLLGGAGARRLGRGSGAAGSRHLRGWP
jgi:hypothetical protein